MMGEEEKVGYDEDDDDDEDVCRYTKTAPVSVSTLADDVLLDVVVVDGVFVVVVVVVVVLWSGAAMKTSSSPSPLASATQMA